MQELSHPAAPPEIAAWIKSPPVWLLVQTPTSIPSHYDHLDFGERQALALAKEIGAEYILLDDGVARRFAEGETLKVKGTLGIIAEAARVGLLNFRSSLEGLQQTTMHLDPQLVGRLIAEYEKWMGQ